MSKEKRWFVPLLIVVCSLMGACENPWVKKITDPLFKEPPVVDEGGPGTYNIGDTGPGGGIIFYRSDAGFTLYQTAGDTAGITAHCLEAAPANMPTVLGWATSGNIYLEISGTGTAIGTGWKNTALILNADANAPAAKACNDLTTGGKTDWFLPSIFELNELYEQRIILDIPLSEYWSLTQADNDGASSQDFNDGIQYGAVKTRANLVRAVRAF